MAATPAAAEIFMAAAPLLAGASAAGASADGPSAAGPSATGEGASIAGAGGDETSGAGASTSASEGVLAADGVGEDALGAGVDFEGAADDFVGAADGEKETLGDAAGELVGALPAEAKPVMARKTRARTTNWRAILISGLIELILEDWQFALL